MRILFACALITGCAAAPNSPQSVATSDTSAYEAEPFGNPKATVAVEFSDTDELKSLLKAGTSFALLQERLKTPDLTITGNQSSKTVSYKIKDSSKDKVYLLILFIDESNNLYRYILKPIQD